MTLLYRIFCCQALFHVFLFINNQLLKWFIIQSSKCHDQEIFRMRKKKKDLKKILLLMSSYTIFGLQEQVDPVLPDYHRIGQFLNWFGYSYWYISYFCLIGVIGNGVPFDFICTNDEETCFLVTIHCQDYINGDKGPSWRHCGPMVPGPWIKYMGSHCPSSNGADITILMIQF